MTTPIEQLLAKLPDAKKSGKGWIARCPAHDDQRASLSIAEGDEGRALLKCHAGCSIEDVCKSIDVRVSELMPISEGASPIVYPSANNLSRIDAAYDYCDETGKLLFQVVRFKPKDFRQRRPVGSKIKKNCDGAPSTNSSGGIEFEPRWSWSVKGVRAVPYRLPELIADKSQIVFVVEGEKDVDNIARLGLVSTCNAGGAGKWTNQHSEFLRGRRVVVLSDNDDAGRNHAKQVARSLSGIAEWVRIVELPNLPTKGDVSDWIVAGGTKTQLVQIAELAHNWTVSTDEPWPEIVRFDAMELPAFPTHVLPKVLRDWVDAESHATQTPPDLAALLALAVMSSCISRRVEVNPRPGWREPVNLYAAVLLDPGNRKSAVFSDATKPLREYEAELVEAARSIVAQEQSKRRQDEAQLRKLEKLAGEKGDSEARTQACKLAADLADRIEIALPRLIVDDATSEKLGTMLLEQQGRLASMSPEGGVFDLMAGMYSKSGIPQFGVYLMGHSGDDLVTDRISRKSVRVERPALTCAYAMQPSVIAGLAENAAFRGRGLLARFLYAAPQSWIGHREIAPETVHDSTKEAYCHAVRRLAATTGEFVLRLDSDAELVLRDWETEIEAMLGEGGQMEVLCDWGAKLAGATLRIAAVLHCLEHGVVGTMSTQTIKAAVAIARYLIPHAEAVLNLMSASEESGNEDAQYVLRWIERHGKIEFTKSEAQHHGKRRFPKANDIDDALSELTRRGFIRQTPMEVIGPGRPSSPKFEVNPELFESMKEKRSPNSCKSNSETDFSNFGNNGSAPEKTEAAKRVRVTI